jgi:integrase
VSESDPRVTKLLKARSVAYPVQFPTPAKLSDMKLLVATFSNEWPSLTAIATMTFIYGQRISDMIQLAVCDLDVQKNFLVITVRRGKTFTTAKPYALWMTRNRFPTEELISIANHAKKSNRIFLFSETNSEQERSKVLQTIHDMIVCVNDDLELRSLRRGGLHLMAENGHPLTSIIKFSRHADTDMLMRYLNWGTISTNHRDEMIATVDKSCEQIESVIQEMNQPTMSLQGCSKKFTQ